MYCLSTDSSICAFIAAKQCELKSVDTSRVRVRNIDPLELTSGVFARVSTSFIFVSSAIVMCCTWCLHPRPVSSPDLVHQILMCCHLQMCWLNLWIQTTKCQTMMMNRFSEGNVLLHAKHLNRSLSGIVGMKWCNASSWKLNAKKGRKATHKVSQVSIKD